MTLDVKLFHLLEGVDVILKLLTMPIGLLPRLVDIVVGAC